MDAKTEKLIKNFKNTIADTDPKDFELIKSQYTNMILMLSKFDGNLTLNDLQPITEAFEEKQLKFLSQ